MDPNFAAAFVGRDDLSGAGDADLGLTECRERGNERQKKTGIRNREKERKREKD